MNRDLNVKLYNFDQLIVDLIRVDAWCCDQCVGALCWVYEWAKNEYNDYYVNMTIDFDVDMRSIELFWLVGVCVDKN